MVSLIWLVVTAGLVSAGASTAAPPTATASKCPRGCNCTETSTAVCNTLDVEPFNDEIANLKIINPKEPLLLIDGIFHDIGLKSVNYIHIENATIVEMDEGAFSQLISLTALNLYNCEILEFSSNIVANVTTLGSLNLSGSKITGFTSIRSSSLEELDMSRCRLTEITEETFNYLPALSYLNLEHNEIAKIHPLAFVNLTNLEELLLGNNKLSHLMPNLLENNLELVTLDLSYNPLGNFNLNIISFLEKLVLKGCNLKNFDTDFGKNLDYLPFLDLSENEIETIDKSTFSRMPRLQSINLSNNKLRGLDADVFSNNSKLLRIILDNNNIQILPKFTNKNGYFETTSFICNNCNLTKLSPDTFTYMRGLTILRLSNNSFEEIDPEVLEKLPSLRELDFSYNKIEGLKPNTFAKLTQLERLSIAGNPLKKPLDPNVFYHTKALKSLDASSCHLKQLWSDSLHSSMPSIRQLFIANNYLTSVNPRDLQVLANLQVLDLSNNPLECSQMLKDTITYLTQRGVYPASAIPNLKTHESLQEDVAAFEETTDKLPTWKKLAKDSCDDEDYFDDNDYDNEDEIKLEVIDTPEVVKQNSVDIDKKTEGSDEYDEDDDDEDYYLDYDQKSTENNAIDDDDDDKVFEEVKTEIDLDQLATESREFREKKEQEAYSYLSPTLVFILTAASVLVIAANVMLLILRSKGALIPQRESNLPHIKILPWNAVNKLKKHSGSVYQQLSEERSAPTTPKVNRYQKLPIVHNSNA